MLRHLFLFTLVPFFCFTSFLFSAQGDSSETEQPEIEYSINVTADRLAEPLTEKSDSITVIEREEIERHQWRFVSEALRDVPGIAIVQSGSPGKTASAFVRGSDSAQVLVLIDGIPINDPYFGGVALEELTTDNVERIEIVRGPQSPLYGSESMGGVINIITRTGEPGVHPEARFEAGSFQTFRESAGLSGAVEEFDYSLAIARQDSQGQFDNDEHHESTISVKGTYRFDAPTEVSFVTRVHDSQIGIPFNSSFEPAPDRNQESRSALFGANLSHFGGQYWNPTVRASFTRIDFLFEDPQDFFPLSKHDSGILQAMVQNDFHLGKSGILSAGFELENRTIDASDQNGEIAGLNNFEDDIYSFFTQNKYQSKRWIVTAGFRFDHHSSFGDTLNPRISVAFLPNAKWKVRGGAATGFRAPTAGDLLFPFYGNPDLKPEKSRSWEIGFDHFLTDHASISATWFQNKFRDLITFDPNTFLAGNIARATTQGLELSGNVAVQRWQFNASYTYLNSEDEVEQHPLFRRPEHSGAMRVSYQQQKWGSSFRILTIGERLETDFRVFPTMNVLNPGYVRADLSGHFNISSSMQLFGRFENLFDADYEEVLHFPAPGIGLYGGIRFTR